MHWNHRVIEHTEKDGTKYYGIHEVYYDDKGNPRAYTEDAVGVMWGEDEPDAAKETLERMMRCLEHPILKAADFPAGLNWDEI